MAVTDGYLRQGADLLAALGRPDGLLFLAGPDTGVPGTIFASGTLAVAVTLTGRESMSSALLSPGGYVILPGHGLIRWAVPAGRCGDQPAGARLSGPDGQPITSPATRTGRIITDA